MGLYDDLDNSSVDESFDDSNSDEIGGAILKASKKKKKKFALPKIMKGKNGITGILPKILMYILGVFVVVILLYGVYINLQPSMISYNLTPNPQFIGDTTEGVLTLDIKNTTDRTISNITIEVIPVDDLSISVIPSDKIIIPKIGPQAKRTLSYRVGLIGSAPAGEYAINIRAIDASQGQSYEKTAMWEIKRFE